ncbi:MAG: hypothetical protein M1825_005530 [Sarcosagium campestre]|nr:MAG: hypothetical protein M1825_005530 [Sarcosagium campestre]
MRLNAALLPLGLLTATGLAKSGGWTEKHEKGRCALRGHCGKQSFFGSELPCPDNEPAEDPDSELRGKIVEVCGDKWKTGAVCCRDEQLETLKSNLNRAAAFISSCPACETNFLDLFCTFTCSPDQSQFLNVTDVGTSTSKEPVVTELDYIVSDSYGEGFYESCKNVKYSATNGNAIDIIGGGAKNSSQLLKFLGDKRPLLGSPFQMNFPPASKFTSSPIEAMDNDPKRCNDDDVRYRCACVDCPAVCPELPTVTESEMCYVGLLPCMSFAVILVYFLSLVLLAGGVGIRHAWKSHSQRKTERLRLLHEAAPSDDEDEGDVVHNAGVLDRPQRNYYLNSLLDTVFSRIGSFCATYPWMTIGISTSVVIVLCLGWTRFAVERDPIKLWVSPTSAAAEEKAFFDDNFGPFYRTQQAYVVNDTDPSGPGPVLSYETLGWWFDVESRVQRLKSIEAGVLIDDVCFKPVGDACVIQSLTGYFPGGFADLQQDTWTEKLKGCTDQPVNCLPDFQQPIRKEMVLGGWEQSGDVLDSKALIVTWVINNHAQGSKEEARAMDWEESLKSLLLAVQGEASDRGLRLSFSTEISLEQELNRTTNTDAKIVVVSYVIMFVYVAFALGSTGRFLKTLINTPTLALVQSKFTLAVAGIVIVLMSVAASVGLFSYAGVKVTLIIAEVIPFLVLAIGVDNIFLIVHEFERVNVSNADETIEERMSKTLGRMGPSILLSATTETIAFVLGAFVGMPAVRNFAAYAAGAVVINALLQVTMFVSVLTLNQQRVEQGRADCFPFWRIQKSSAVNGHGPHGIHEADGEGFFQRFIREKYAPALLNKKVKIGVLLGFTGLFTLGLALIPEVELGLDQRIAIPRGSYLIPYFNDLATYFATGPPVYFVMRELNVTKRSHQQQLCGRFTTCDSYSLSNVLEQERKRSGVSYIAKPPASWIDDFFLWLNPALDSCCIEDDRVCFDGRDPAWNNTLYGMPEGSEFVHYLEKWIQAPTGAECAIAGKAAYGDAIVVDSENLTIPASHFRSSHTPLHTQDDFIKSYASARRISDSISETSGFEVFPYSKFYIFFDQYATIVRLTGALLGSALGFIFLLTSIFLGSILTGAVVTVVVAMIVVDIIGAMAVAGVSLNAVSLVNLVICVGIAVEFCAHIARAFMFPSRSIMERARRKFRGKDLRAWTALVNVGGSVITGITITKLLGVFVLAFTRSKIFEVYYFRIWLALVIFAASHALIFLPVALSICGGDGYVDPESDGSLEDDLTSRRYRALDPGDEYDSD